MKQFFWRCAVAVVACAVPPYVAALALGRIGFFTVLVFCSALLGVTVTELRSRYR